MTLVIGAKYPWGSIRRLIAYERNLPQGIVLVSDSRWTKFFPDKTKCFEDVGAKIFKLTMDSAIAYSGDVQSGEHCISELSRKLGVRKLKGSNSGTFKTSLRRSVDTFQRTYAFHIKTRGKDYVFPLFFLIGTCDKKSRANLIHFKSPKFEPEMIDGMYGIGVEQAYRECAMEVKKEIDYAVDNEFKTRIDAPYPVITMPSGRVVTTLPRAASLVCSAMENTILKPQKYQGVGGLMQCRIVDEIGVNVLQAFSSRPGETSTWERLTATPKELTSYHERYKLGPSFISAAEFKLHQISE